MRNVLDPTFLRCKTLFDISQLSAIRNIYPCSKLRFTSPVAASTYGREVVMNALKISEPYERAIIKRRNFVLADIVGDANQVNISEELIEKLGPNLTIIHGHPTNLPLSVQDYVTLMKNDNIQSVVAYNADGEYSKLTKLPKKQFKYFSKYRHSRLLKKRIDNARYYMGMHIYNLRTKIGKNMELLKKIHSEQISQKIKQQHRELANKMNIVWSEYSKELGVKYEHNFK